MWSLTYPALIDSSLALLTALIQLVIAPLPVSILCLVQVSTGAWDSPHLHHNNTEPAHLMIMTSFIVFFLIEHICTVHCVLPMIPLGFSGLFLIVVLNCFGVQEPL